MTDPVTRVGLQLAGYSFPGVADAGIFARVAEIATAAEDSGFDSLWTMDHLHQIDAVGDREEPILEAYTTLAALAAVTHRARLGVLVTAAGFRNPALLAKMVTTIDVISRGRAVLGIGAGWLADEYESYGYPFPPAGERLRQLAEAVRVCRAMFTEHAPHVDGVHHHVRGALNVPAPLSAGGPPILIGGGGERVLIPLVAELGDACNFFGAPATVRHKIDVLERACAKHGRNPDEITKTWLGHVLLSDDETQLQLAIDRLARLYHLSPRASRGFALCGGSCGPTGRPAWTGSSSPCSIRTTRTASAGPVRCSDEASMTEQADGRRDGVATAEVLTAAFQTVLELPAVDPAVGFFDLGATSADIVRVTALLRATWPTLRVVELFLHPTIESLVAFLDQQPRGPSR